MLCVTRIFFSLNIRNKSILRMRWKQGKHGFYYNNIIFSHFKIIIIIRFSYRFSVSCLQAQFLVKVVFRPLTPIHKYISVHTVHIVMPASLCLIISVVFILLNLYFHVCLVDCDLFIDFVHL